MGSLHTYHQSDALGRGASQAIWSKCPFEEIARDPTYGYGLNTDFLSFGGVVATNVGTYSADGIGGMKSFENNSCTLVQTEASAEIGGGIIRFSVDATDNNEVGVEAGYGNAGMFTLSTAGEKLAFECRVRLTQVTDQCVYFGLAEKGLAVTDGLFANDATASGTKDLIGFVVNSATPSIIRSTYGVNGTTTTLHSAAQTAEAATWYKLGFYSDGSYLRFFVNGVEVGTKVAVSTSTTNLPDGILLTPFFNIKTGAASVRSMDMDWFACYQWGDRLN